MTEESIAVLDCYTGAQQQTWEAHLKDETHVAVKYLEMLSSGTGMYLQDSKLKRGLALEKTVVCFSCDSTFTSILSA